LLLVKTDWCNSNQARKVVEKGERNRKEGIDDREWVLTSWVIDARTILVMIDMKMAVAHIP
jgi:hypothetical protein